MQAKGSWRALCMWKEVIAGMRFTLLVALVKSMARLMAIVMKAQEAEITSNRPSASITPTVELLLVLVKVV